MVALGGDVLVAKYRTIIVDASFSGSGTASDPSSNFVDPYRQTPIWLGECSFVCSIGADRYRRLAF